MSQSENVKRRPRGPSPRGDFEAAKMFATASEDARVAANKQKTEALRQARLMKSALAPDQSASHSERSDENA